MYRNFDFIEIKMLVIILVACFGLASTQSEENGPCETEQYKGRCAVRSNCTSLNYTMEAMNITSGNVGQCGPNLTEEVICCPDSAHLSTTEPPSSIDFTTISPKGVRDLLSSLPALERMQKFRDLLIEAGLLGRQAHATTLIRAVRPAVRACKEIEKHLMFSSLYHILGDDPVEAPTAYPHMADIVYDSEVFKCGGTLIAKRFVLTAAHCLEVKGAKAVKVRLGVTDFNDTAQMQDLVEVDIKATYIHENYSSFSHYYDFGVIELDKDVVYTAKIYPTCLHTSAAELPDNTELVVTGWGRNENKTFPARLMSAYLNLVTPTKCNISYASSIDRQLSHGIDETQLCAFASDKDVCWGHSGGPIHLVKDRAFNNYRVVGVVSFGLLCGSNVPGVYSRVTSFLDFVEGIVWPEG